MDAASRCRARAVVALALAASATPGCSLLSPLPLWELGKAAGTAATMALPYLPPKANGTVYHEHAPLKAVCIEYNPQAPVANLLPVLQSELRRHRVDSRVYDEGAPPDRCEVWLHYRADVGWDQPPLESDWRPFLQSASLSLRRADGRVLSSSHYEADDSGFGRSKWASTQAKLAPVVAALLTGFEPS